MELQHSFQVPVGINQAWEVLLDIERVAPCMPGAVLDSVDGDDLEATVKVRLGPMSLTYKCKATFVEKDPTAHRLIVEGRGRDTRGNGTVKATVTAVMTGDASNTSVSVLTDLEITGKPAQFGRGVLEDVGGKLIGQFADSLARTLEPEQAVAEGVAPTSSTQQSAGDSPNRPAPSNDAIDLGATLLPVAARRFGPYAVIAVLVILVLRLVRKSATSGALILP